MGVVVVAVRRVCASETVKTGLSAQRYDGRVDGGVVIALSGGDGGGGRR